MPITRAEWRWVLAASVLVLLLSTIPYLAGYLSETADLRFGGAVFDRQDYNVHLASIHTGLRGDWQYPLLHTSENVSPAYIKSFYIVVGQIGRIGRASPPALYEATRWLCGLWMLLMLYAFAARFLWSVPLRRAAFLFGALGSGIGWLLMVFQWQPDPNISPIDFWLIDLYGFFSLLTLPHLSAVMALLWTATLAMLTHWETGKYRWLSVCIISIVLVQQIQPFAPLVVDVTLAVYTIWDWFARRRRFPLPSLVLLALTQIPLAVYSIAILYGDPVWSSFSRQNVTLSPQVVYYILGLGIPGVLAAIGAWRVARRANSPAHLLVVWVSVVAIFVYLPVLFQRRFTEGMSAPIAILAAMGWGYVILPALARWKNFRRALARRHYPYRRARDLMLTLALVTTMFSTFYLAFGGALLGVIRLPKLFEPTAVVEAMDWLGAHADWRDTVFSSERTGSYLPARIGQRVYLGHEMETANYPAKSKTAAHFFSATMDDAARLVVLRECACRFVFWGPHERALGSFQPDSAGYLRQVYATRDVTIYRVVESQ